MVKIEVIPNTNILNIADYEEMSYSLGHGDLFLEFCKKKKLAISLPYIGGQYWALEIAKLGHIAVMEDAFGVCAYSNYKTIRSQREKLAIRKPKWEKVDFSGVVVMEDGSLKNFDQELLHRDNSAVLQEFIQELTPKVVLEKENRKRRRF